MDDIAEMFEAARRARANAHAPYSGFAVGACLASDDGRLFAGCNVENAAYPQSQCAEAGAIAALVAAGARRISAILVLAAGPPLCPPCGGCRQRLAEFAGPDTPIDVIDPSGEGRTFTMRELLPSAFDMDRK